MIIHGDSLLFSLKAIFVFWEIIAEFVIFYYILADIRGIVFWNTLALIPYWESTLYPAAWIWGGSAVLVMVVLGQEGVGAIVDRYILLPDYLSAWRSTELGVFANQLFR